MIKTDKGEFRFSGTTADLIADFGVVCACVYDALGEGEDMSHKDIMELMTSAFALGVKTAKDGELQSDSVPEETDDPLAALVRDALGGMNNE